MIEERLAEARKSAVGQALDTVRRRIDAMGIAEPNIYPKNRQIVIELPGLSDTTTEIKAARKDLIQAAPDPPRRRGGPGHRRRERQASPSASS
jgi:preprotein translocase subunit SecD